MVKFLLLVDIYFFMGVSYSGVGVDVFLWMLVVFGCKFITWLILLFSGVLGVVCVEFVFEVY